MNAVNGGDDGGPKCHKCGHKGHVQGACPTDLTKVRCYKCGGVGHISANCKVAPTSDGKPTYQGKGSKGTSPGKGPSNSNQKPKGKGGSKGKKGKMFAVCDDSGTWWYTEATEGESFEETAEESAEPAAPAEESVLVLSSVLSPWLRNPKNS